MILPIDQRIRDAGFNFVPFNRFLASPFQIPQDDTVTADPNTGAGIATLQPSGGGGGNPFTGGIADLTSGFQTAVDDRQARLTELNRPLAEAQFPSFKDAYGTFTMPDGRVVSNIENAQKLYNQASGYIREGMDPNTIAAPNFSYRGVTDPTISQIQNMAADQIEDFREKYRTGQFGPSFIEAEKPTIGRRIQDFIYSTPFFNKPQSADQIIQEGYEPQIKLGIMANLLPDRFGDLPRGDQAFIQRNMGYTGPTVFGENTTGGAKDPFGLNVRSGFGNYAERVGIEAEKLGDDLSGRLADKYGVEFDPVTGTFVGKNAARANQMTKLMRAKFNFYTQQTKQRDADRAAAAAAQTAEERAAGRIANQQMQRQEGGGGGSNLTRSREQGGLGLTASQAQAISEANRAAGMGGYGLADGGIVDMLEIYD